MVRGHPRAVAVMRRLSHALLALTLSTTTAWANPPLVAESPEGELEELALHPGERALIVHFWATWCSGCIVELPVLAAARGQCADHGVRIVEVNVGEKPSDVARFLEDHGLDLQSWFDRKSKTWRSMRAHGLPVTVTWAAAGQELQVGPRTAVAWREALASVGCGGV